jgi:myo-inositol-1(or 4)-monophosphatase
MLRPEGLLSAAMDAVSAACAEIRAGRSVPVRVNTKGDRDLVSEVDLAVERTVREFLARRTPQIGFLGEEEGSVDRSADPFWVLDPIDGTVNFVRGLPMCAVALALVHRGRPVLGVIDLPFLDQRYSAVAGGGAYRNGARLAVRPTEALSLAVVALGDFAVGADSPSKNRLRFEVATAAAAVALRVRMLGSAAIDLAWLAEGSLDASIVLSNKPWDVAAGVVIAREAGARVVDVDGSDHTMGSSATLAAPPSLIGELVTLVQRSAEIARNPSPSQGLDRR